MDFRILGPLEVATATARCGCGGKAAGAAGAAARQCEPHAGDRHRIVDELWGEDVPETAQKTGADSMSRVYAKRCRPGCSTRARRDTRSRSSRRPSTSTGSSSSSRPAHGVDAGHPDPAAEGFRAALQLWRGPALAEFVSEPFARAEAAPPRRAAPSALEERIESDLALGRDHARPRARAARRRAPLPRAPTRPADARALPLRTAGGRAPRPPERAPVGWSRSSGSSQVPLSRSSSDGF